MTAAKDKARTLPYNSEAEAQILGVLFYEGIRGESEATDDIMSSLTPGEFYIEHHGTIFTAMQLLYGKGKSIDLPSVYEILECEKATESVGGMTVLSALSGTVFSAANYKSHLTIVKNNALLRDYVRAGQSISELALSGKAAPDVRAEAEDMLNVLSASDNKTEYEHIGGASTEERERIKKAAQGEYDSFGLSTGFQELNRTLWGLQKSDMVIIAARPGIGKTAFALNILRTVCVTNHNNALLFSLEMPKSQIVKRLYSIMTGIDHYLLKTGKDIDDKEDALDYVEKKLNASGLYIDDKCNQSVAEMLVKAKKLKRKSGLSLVVIDYLQIARPLKPSNNRAVDVGQMARDIKNMARILDVPVIALSQISREKDRNEGRPVLADLRESGDIENNSDIVMFLHTTQKDKKQPVIPIDLIIEKFRNGQLKTIPFEYTGNIFTFKETEREDENATPPPPRTEQTKMPLRPLSDEEAGALGL